MMEKVLFFCLGFFFVKECHVSFKYSVCVIKNLHIELQQILKRKLGFVKLLVVSGFPTVLTFISAR